MGRDIILTTNYAEGTSVELVLCDKYLHDLGVASQALVVGVDGMLSTNVSVNENEECWVIFTPDKKQVFWVYAGEEIQMIDLTNPLYKHRTLPVFLEVNTNTMKVNVSSTFARLACGVPLVCEEEQHLMCRFSSFAVGEDDEEMCAVNTALST